MSNDESTSLAVMTMAETVARLDAGRSALATARQALLHAELDALAAQFNLNTTEGELAEAMLLAQASAPASCTNETQRKAHAVEQTEALRRTLAELNLRALATEVELARCKTNLRLAEDERRTVEAVVALWADGRLPITGRPSGYAVESDIPF